MRDKSFSVIDDAPLNTFHRKLLVYSSGGPFLDGFALTIIGVAFITLKPALDLNATDAGVAAAAALVGIFVGGSVFGFVTDLVGRKVMYILDLAVLTLASLASAFVTDIWQLVVLRFILGIAIGADYPIASSLLAEFVPRRHRGRLLGALFVVWAAGAAAAAGVGWALSGLGDDSWRYMLASPAVIGAVTLAFRLGTPESPRWLANKGRHEEAQAICRKIWQADVPLESLLETEQRTSIKTVLRGRYLRRIVFVSVFYTAHVIPLFAIYSFGPDILHEIGVGGESIYGAELIISALFLIGGVPGLYLVDRVGRIPLLVWTFVIMIIAFTTMAVLPDADPVLLCAALATYAIASGACNFMEIIYPNELFPTSVRATATGLVVAISRIGSAATTFAFPAVLSATGVSGVMWVMAGVNVAGLLVTLFLGEETKGRELRETSAIAPLVMGAEVVPVPHARSSIVERS